MNPLLRVSISLLAVLLSGAWAVAGADEAHQPAASVDLMAPDGVSLMQGSWRYKDVELTRVPFHAPGDDGQPTGAEISTWDIQPHAGGRDFDDRDWPVIGASTLAQHRGPGRLSFAWYRIQVTVPPLINGFETRGSSVDFETSIDDYAEVWVDGELPRAFAQSGGSVIKGWNAVNHLTIVRNVQPGQKIQIAVFGINGPLSDPPTNFIWMRLAKLTFYRPDPPTSGAIAVEPQEVNVHVERLDPSIDGIVPPNAKLYKLAEGFQFTEGPIWIRDGGYLLFSDPNANRIYSYDPKNAVLAVYRDHSGYEGSDIGEYGQPGSNGLTVDRQGRLTINQHGNRRVVRVEADGSRTVLAAKYRGKRLNSPNDLVYKSDGSLYFTDPPFGLPKFFDDPRKELNFSGVFRAIDGKVTLVTDELDGPNGLAFSPAEDFLYVDNWSAHRKVILRFPVRRDGTVGKSQVFVDMTAELPGDDALDGMKVDSQGNLYVTAPDGVRIYSPAGKHLGTITVPRVVHNLAWGGADGRTLYLCASDRLYRIDVLIPGPLP
ncbi:MAG TPA: SMP-30/gluconolactonase/LRE family protein [Steroidobacteraceae bacterium]|nr:SMP-30/gluconolactonase/LRE family protein [Steroidobacteraceae bacterium]